MEKIKVYGKTFEFDSKVKSLEMNRKTILHLSRIEKIVRYIKVKTETEEYIIANDLKNGEPDILKMGGKILLKENDLYNRLNEEQKDRLYMIISNYHIDKDFIITELEMPTLNDMGISMPCLTLNIDGVILATGINVEDLKR